MDGVGDALPAGDLGWGKDAWDPGIASDLSRLSYMPAMNDKW